MLHASQARMHEQTLPYPRQRRARQGYRGRRRRRPSAGPPSTCATTWLAGTALPARRPASAGARGRGAEARAMLGASCLAHSPRRRRRVRKKETKTEKAPPPAAARASREAGASPLAAARRAARGAARRAGHHNARQVHTAKPRRWRRRVGRGGRRARPHRPAHDEEEREIQVLSPGPKIHGADAQPEPAARPEGRQDTLREEPLARVRA